MRLGQVYNPTTGKWVKVDRDTGAVMGESPRQYSGVPLVHETLEQEAPKRPRPASSGVSDPLAAVRV